MKIIKNLLQSLINNDSIYSDGFVKVQARLLSTDETPNCQYYGLYSMPKILSKDYMISLAL